MPTLTKRHSRRSRALQTAGKAASQQNVYSSLPIANDFLVRFEAIQIAYGRRPTSEETDIGPCDRADPRRPRPPVAIGPVLSLTGGKSGKSWIFTTTILDGVTPDMPAYSEDLVVAACIRVSSVERILSLTTLALAWGPRFGHQIALIDTFVSELEAGCVFLMEW